MYVVLVEVCKGSLIEVVIGMSIIHSLGVISTDSTTAVERHIMTVETMFTTTSAVIKLQGSREGPLASAAAAAACS